LTNFSEQIEPDFLWYYLMSEYDDLRALASGNNQPNLNAEMIATYPLPLPPLAIQREIVAQVEAARAEVAGLRAQVAQRARESAAEVEAAILGNERL
jgi:restriction endonuclease S subunit